MRSESGPRRSVSLRRSRRPPVGPILRFMRVKDRAHAAISTGPPPRFQFQPEKQDGWRDQNSPCTDGPIRPDNE